MDQTELVDRARAGDRQAMARLYREHAPHVYAIVRRLAGEDHLAQDLSQEVWIRAFDRLDQFRGDAGFGTWVHRIARNMAISHLRRSKRRAEVEAEAAPGETAAPGGDLALERRALEEALERLPPGYRTVLVLHDVEGLTHEEIAESLGVAVGTSKSQLHKARARMRELLTHDGEKDNEPENEARADV